MTYAKSAGQKLKIKGLKLSVAESCTGGMLSSMITDVQGSSTWFKGAVVAYTDEVKKRILGVKASTLKKYGAVSKETALELAKGVRKKLNTNIGVSITGIAGPGKGTKKTPVGTVFIAFADKKGVYSKKIKFKGTRQEIKKKAALEALRTLSGAVKTQRGS